MRGAPVCGARIAYVENAVDALAAQPGNQDSKVDQARAVDAPCTRFSHHEPSDQIIGVADRRSDDPCVLARGA